MIRLHVNIDHVATVRNARGTAYPDPVRAAEECIAAGADGITAHLREDRRHVRDDDIVGLRATLSRAHRTMNLEIAPTDEMIGVALRVRPEVCTLVPERRKEVTTEGGLDVVAGGDQLAQKVGALVAVGIKVSMFIGAEVTQIERSLAIGAAQVELHTGEYAHGSRGELERLRVAAATAHGLRLEVAAGHGLTQDNVFALAGVHPIAELNIGHALISDALFLGLRGAVTAYREAIARGVRSRTGAVSTFS